MTDVPDQSAIVRQYMRYTSQIQSGKTAAKVIMRALQLCVFAIIHLHDHPDVDHLSLVQLASRKALYT